MYGSPPFVCVFPLSVLLGCAGKDGVLHPQDDTSPAPPEWVDADGATLNVGESIDYTDASGVRRFFTLEFGFVSHPDETVNYDPYNLVDPDLDYAKPAGLDWVQPQRADWNGADYALSFDEGSALLHVDDTGPGFALSVTQDSDDEWAPYVRLTVNVDPGEGLYGLGEQFGDVEHRGTVHAMQFELWGDIESANNEAHVPVPLLVSSMGWGLLARSYRPGLFDLQQSGTVQVTYNQLQDEGFTFDLYGPGTGAEVTARYHQRTGSPEVPPTWAFAPLQWRNALGGADDVYADMQAIRAYGIPTGLIWLDNPWQSTYNSMIPDPTMFPDWDGLVEDLHAQGFRTMAWSTPYLEEDEPDHDRYETNSWFVDAAILLNDFGDWVDLTNDDAMVDWQGRVTGAIDLGIEGWKLDYGEDTQVGIGSARLRYAFDNGEDERTMHHKYTLWYHHAYADPYPIEPDGTHAGFILGRAGVLGGHTVTDCIWPGDLDNDFAFFSRTEGTVGGLSSAIRGGTGLAASGYPFFASDTGGYRGGRPSKEVMIRWTEYSATLPIMQYGGAGEDHNPWNFGAYDDDGPSQFDQQTLDDFTRYAVLHIRLFPYFWELAQRARAEGLPTIQALGLAYPELGVHPQNEYLVGDDILVAPVEVEGATSRTVDFPPGTWIHWWSDEVHTGPDVGRLVLAPLGEGPLYQRAGSAIPMLRRTVMTLSPTDGSVDSWADDAGVLNARVYPDETGASFVLGTGEALSADPWPGDADAPRVIHLTSGSVYDGWDLEIYGGATSVSADGLDLPEGVEGCDECWFNEEGPWVRVVTRGSEIEVRNDQD